MKTEFDEETEKWFSSRPYTETTVMQCEKCHLWSESTLMQCAECGLWYKPSLGHKCKKMAEAQEKGKGKKMESHMECNIYDEEEVIENCTVQIWRNSVTGEESVGWWRGKKEDMPQ